MARVLTNNSEHAPAFYEYAGVTAFFYRCFDFHNNPPLRIFIMIRILYFLLVAVRNTASGQIIHRQLNRNSVPGKNLDKMHTHLA